MAPNLYNVTFTSQASSIRYSPQRDGPIDAGWNVTYTGTNDFSRSAAAVGNDSRRTTLSGASLEMDWFGTAAYIYGQADVGTYTLSVDGSEGGGGQGEDSLLGKFEGLEYGNHTVRMDVGQTSNPVVFRQALLTIQIGDSDSSVPQNRTVPSVIADDSQSLRFNPFYSFQPAGNWVLQDADTARAEDGSTIRYNLRRASSFRAGDTALFTLANASAFFIYGALNWDHLGIFVTITPLSASDPTSQDSSEPPRTRYVNDSSSFYDLQNIMYWESGLDRNKTYNVTVLNPDLRLGDAQTAFGIRFMDVIDATPSNSTDTDDGGVGGGGNTGGDGDGDGGLSGGAIAGIVVGVAAGLSILAFAIFFLLRRRRRKERAARSADLAAPTAFPLGLSPQHDEAPRHPQFYPQGPHGGLSPPGTSTDYSGEYSGGPMREVDAGPLPPMYQPEWESSGAGTGSGSQSQSGGGSHSQSQSQSGGGSERGGQTVLSPVRRAEKKG